jgi:hypothetical protein
MDGSVVRHVRPPPLLASSVLLAESAVCGAAARSVARVRCTSQLRHQVLQRLLGVGVLVRVAVDGCDARVRRLEERVHFLGRLRARSMMNTCVRVRVSFPSLRCWQAARATHLLALLFRAVARARRVAVRSLLDLVLDALQRRQLLLGQRLERGDVAV